MLLEHPGTLENLSVYGRGAYSFPPPTAIARGAAELAAIADYIGASLHQVASASVGEGAHVGPLSPWPTKKVVDLVHCSVFLFYYFLSRFTIIKLP